jgi:DedD protein
MAKTVSDEEVQLRKRARRRLVGAVTLVVAAIVILPMLLDSKPEERSQEIDIRIPSEDSVEEFEPGPAHLAGASDAAIAGKSPDGAQQPEQLTPVSPVKPVPSTEPAAKPVPKPAGNKADTKAGSEGGKSSATTATPVTPSNTPTSGAADAFVVQLGAYSSPAKARQQLQSLMSREPGEYTGSPADPEARAYTETVKVNKDVEKGFEKSSEKGLEKGIEKGEITRVRVGPFRTREQAEASREKLRRLGFDGVVTDK